MIGPEPKPPQKLYWHCLAFTDGKSFASVIMGLAEPQVTMKDTDDAIESLDGEGFGLMAVSLLGCMTENEYRGTKAPPADADTVEQGGGIGNYNPDPATKGI